MANLFSSSIGRKLIMSISGLFLIVFLCLHLGINLLLLIPDGGVLFNQAANFMATNPLIKVMEPVLALGFLIHIIYATSLTLQNKKARGNMKYASGSASADVTWTSKNMYVLGFAVFVFIIIHMLNFWVKIKITHDILPITIDGVEMHNTYALVNACFGLWYYVVIYVIGAFALAHHLMHGFWSAFQTIGFNNNVWMPRLKVIGAIIAWLYGIGFAAIAVGQFLFFQ